MNVRIAHVIGLHFDRKHGSPYWLERQDSLGLDARRDIRSVADFPKLGPMNEVALASRPIEDFIPRSLLHRRDELFIGQTAGTLGRPKFGVHRRDEFQQAFVDPFLAAANRARFPRELNWLFVGPSGPHIIGRAASACARAMGSADPFTIDLDPRWAKKLPSGTFAWRRYLEHVEEQALAIVDAQQIGVIFSTPIVLESLAKRIPPAKVQAIRGIHLGGISVSPAQRELFARQFPRAAILSGYGNSLFGVMPELAFSPETGFDYYPHGLRQIVRIVPAEGGDDRQRLGADVPYGRRGQVVMSRLDEMQLILNLMERDHAERLPPPAWAAADGFVIDGVRDPRPIVNDTVKPATGFY